MNKRVCSKIEYGYNVAIFHSLIRYSNQIYDTVIRKGEVKILSRPNTFMSYDELYHIVYTIQAIVIIDGLTMIIFLI